MTVEELEAEPTRSVLHRSAATLALDCGDYQAAERLIARALTGNPPDEIADEMRDLLEQVYVAWGYRQRSPCDKNRSLYTGGKWGVGSGK